MTDTSNLVLAVDSTQVKGAGATLDSFAASGKRAETATDALTAAALKTEAAQARLTAATTKAKLAQDALAKVNADSASTHDQIAAAQSRVSAALSNVAAASQRAGSASAALTDAKSKIVALGDANKLTAYQSQQLGFQLHDLFVQIASGQSPLTAAIQQGSQLSGTFGGMGGALKAVATLFTTTRVVIGGAAGALAAFAAAAYAGHKESDEFRKSMQLTGGAAGLTEDAFNSLAENVAKSTNSTIGSTRELVQGLVSSGQYGSAAISETAKAAALFGKASGQSAEDVLKNFSTMRGGVSKWAEETNRQYHFLTAVQLEYIRTLEAQGDSQKAVSVTMEALGNRVRGAAADVGILERAWTAAKNAASGFADAAKSVGRTETIDNRLAEAQAKLADLEARGTLAARGGRRQSTTNAEIAAQREVVQTLQARKELLEGSAAADARNAQLEDARIARQKIINENLSKQAQLDNEIKRINAVFDKARTPGSHDDAANEKKRIEALDEARKRFYTTPPTSSLSADIDKIKSNLSLLTDAYKNAESVLDAQRSSGLIGERDYYAAKRGLVKAEEDLEVHRLELTNERIRAERITGKDATEIANKRQDNQKAIAANEAQIARIISDAAAKGQVLNIQQAAGVAQVTRAYKDARRAAEDYLRTLTLQGQRDASAVGKGDKTRNFDAGRDQINDRFEQARRQIESERNALKSLREGGKISDKEASGFEDRLAQEREFQEKSLAQWKDNYSKISAEESKWENGAKRAFENYIDNSANAAKTSESFFTKTFSSIENALTEFAMTGKLDFKSFAQSIIADLIRIQIQAQLAGIFKSFGFGISGAGAASTGAELSANAGMAVGTFAAGGDPPVNRVSLVGERGPELFVPKSAGTIIPNHKLGGTTVIHEHTYNVAAGVSRNELLAAMQLVQKNADARTEQRLRKAGVT